MRIDALEGATVNKALDAAAATLHERHNYEPFENGCAVCRDDAAAVVAAYLDALNPADVAAEVWPVATHRNTARMRVVLAAIRPEGS